MTSRRASCSCGQLALACRGDPVRISVCHCLACQRRTGSVLGVQARFPREQVTDMQGRSTVFVRTADSGNTVTLHSCPLCGSTVYWEFSGFPDVISVAVGAFADPQFPAPRHSVFERTRHPWAASPAGESVEHVD